MAEHNLYDGRERDATPRPGRYRPWFLGLLIVWWLTGCVAFARGGVLAGVLTLEAECALLLALDHANVLTLHRLLPWRLCRGWGRAVAVVCVLCLAPVALALYLGLAARQVWMGAERAEVAVPFAPASPATPAWEDPRQIDEAPTTPMPATPASASPLRPHALKPMWEDESSHPAAFGGASPAYSAYSDYSAYAGASRAGVAAPTRRRTALLVGSGVLAILLLCACVFAVVQAQSGALTIPLGSGASRGTSQTTTGRHHTASAGQRAHGPSATATATTLPPTATTAPAAPTTSTQPTTAPSAPGNGGDNGQGTTGTTSSAGAQAPALPIIPTTPPTSPPTTPPNSTTTSTVSITAAQLAAAERTLPTVYVPSLQMTFSCAGSDAGKAFCVRAHPDTRVTITLYAECAATGGQVISLTRERTVGDSGVVRWNWRPEQPCGRGLALAILTTHDGQQHLVLAVTRDPPPLS